MLMPRHNDLVVVEVMRDDEIEKRRSVWLREHRYDLSWARFSLTRTVWKNEVDDSTD